MSAGMRESLVSQSVMDILLPKFEETDPGHTYTTFLTILTRSPSRFKYLSKATCTYMLTLTLVSTDVAEVLEVPAAFQTGTF